MRIRANCRKPRCCAPPMRSRPSRAAIPERSPTRRPAPTSTSTATRTRSPRPPSPRRPSCCRRSTPGCAPAIPRVRQVTASLAASWQHVEILRADGQIVRDIRPLVRVNFSVVVGEGDRQETGSFGMGGRKSFAEFIAEDSWKFGAEEALRQALVNLDGRSPRRPAPSTSCCPAAGRASCCTRRSATGWKAISTARRPRPSPA